MPLGDTLRSLIRRYIPEGLRFLPSQAMGALGDWQLGIETNGWQDAQRKLRDKALPSDGHGYQPTTYYTLWRLLPHLPLGPEDVLVDLGCGKGRVLLFMAARTNVGQTLGIDLQEDLIEIAKQNASHIRTKARMTFLRGDVGEADLEAGTVFFLFNPFGVDTMARVLDTFERTLTTHPRRLRIVCYNPCYDTLLSCRPWLVKTVALNWRATIWEHPHPT